MKKTSLLIFTALFMGTIGTKAQYQDVTSQYIQNPGFEECEALPTVVYHDNQKNVDIDKIELYQEGSVAKGYDYEAQGWKLVEQQTAVNGGVVTYNCNIQTGKWATAGEPGPANGVSGSKGLCFVGNKGLVYQQANEITLPAGVYRFTVNLYARNGQTTNPGPTQQVVNVKTGFMPTGGTEEKLIPAKRASMQFSSNAWDQEVIDIELMEATTGRFQISYGTSYYVIVDDVKLEYQGGVITTALAEVVTKAQALNATLNDANLTTAINNANAFIANPTSQEDVALQAETLYTAMRDALAATTLPYVDLTSAYVDNWSFETGKIDPWTWGTKTGAVGEPSNELMPPYVDGKNIVTFSQNGTNSVTQTISHLPAGYYIIDAKLNKSANLIVGTNSTQVQGGIDPIMIHVFPAVYQATAAGDVLIGAESNTAFSADAFRLFYAKDEASLIAAVLPAVKADANAILADAQFNNITGEERTELVSAIEGNDGQAIVAAVNAFVGSKDAYNNYVKIKEKAILCTKESYPYAKAETLKAIADALAIECTSRSLCLEVTNTLVTACNNVVWENAYCEGVSNTDYTESIIAANPTAAGTINTAWSANNIEICKLATSKARETREGGSDRYVYGTPDSYKTGASSLQQTISNLPAGTYVMAVSALAATNLPVAVRINNEKKHTIIGKGHYSSNGWNEEVFSFELANDGNITLRLDEAEASGTKMWYVDNFRLYRLNDDTGINNVTNSQRPTANGQYFDLSGRRVAQPAKGLYIVNGQKVIIK